MIMVSVSIELLFCSTGRVNCVRSTGILGYPLLCKAEFRISLVSGQGRRLLHQLWAGGWSVEALGAV